MFDEGGRAGGNTASGAASSGAGGAASFVSEGAASFASGPFGLDELERVVRGLVVEPDEASLERGFAVLDLLSARLIEAVGRFAAARSWRDGSPSAVAWLRAHAGRSDAQARSAVDTAALLKKSPTLAESFRDGRLSEGQVQAVRANVRHHEKLWSEHEADVVGALEPLNVRDTAVVMGRWRQFAESQSDGPPPAERRGFSLSRTLHDEWEGSLHLTAEGGSVLAAALRAAETADCPGEPVRTATQRRADALVELGRHYLNHAAAVVGNVRKRRPHVDVVVTIEKWADQAVARAETADGVGLARHVIEAYLCDATVSRLILAAPSHVLDYGRARRTLPAAVARAVAALDHHCRWGGCDRPPAWCDTHHLDPFHDGGQTSVANHVLLCARHHHVVHRIGGVARRQLDNTVTIKLPDGTTIESRPPP